MTNEERLKKIKWLSRYRILENQIKRLEAEKERRENRSTNTVPAPVHFKYITKKEKLDAMTKDERRRNEMAPVIIRGGNGFGMDDVVAEICESERQLILLRMIAFNWFYIIGMWMGCIWRRFV